MRVLKKQLGQAAIKGVWCRLLRCDCGSELKPVSTIIEGDEIKRYLGHLGLDADPPEPEEMETEEKSVTFSLFEADSYEEEEFPVINHD